MIPSQTRYVSMNLRDYQLDKLDVLAGHMGLSRNRFCRFLWENMTTADVDAIQERLNRS